MKEIDKLRKEYTKALANHDLFKMVSIAQKMDMLKSNEQPKVERLTLKDAITNDSDRELVMAKYMQLMLHLDEAWKLNMEILDMCKKYGIDEIDNLSRQKALDKEFHDIIASIDSANNIKLSDTYAKVTEELDEWCDKYLSNRIIKIMVKNKLIRENDSKN